MVESSLVEDFLGVSEHLDRSALMIFRGHSISPSSFTTNIFSSFKKMANNGDMANLNYPSTQRGQHVQFFPKKRAVFPKRADKKYHFHCPKGFDE